MPPSDLIPNRDPAGDVPKVIPVPAVPGPPSPESANLGQNSDDGDGDDLDLLNLFTILRRRWTWVLGAAVWVLIATAIVYRGTVPIYAGTATLRFDIKGGAAIPGLELQGINPKDELATELVSLQSFSLALDVAEAVRADVTLLEPTRVPRSAFLTEVAVAPSASLGEYTFTRQGAA